jgi:5-methylcytosine-specific restriction endonuclease McrA
MAKSFTSLTKSKTALLHKEIRKNFEGLSSLEIEEHYKKVKSEYDELKFYSDKHKEQEDKYKELRSERLYAQAKVRQEEREAISNMSTLKQIGSIFSTPEYYSAEHNAAQKRVAAIDKALDSHKTDIYCKEVARRKKIYHELKVLSEIRKELKAERVRSLANAKMNKVRSTSSALKRKHISKSDTHSECPYCSKVFETTDLVLDHIYPIAEGGLDTEKNTVLVCHKCNSKKSDKTLMIFCRLMKFDHSEVCDRLIKLGKAV